MQVIIKPSPLKVVAVTYKRRSFTRIFYHRVLTGKIFGVVAYRRSSEFERWSHIEFRLIARIRCESS